MHMNNSVIDVTIEIPKNSNIKYEYDRANGNIKVDRILYGANIYPENYGFIPNALDWDGDELDILVISDHSFFAGKYKFISAHIFLVIFKCRSPWQHF